MEKSEKKDFGRPKSPLHITTFRCTTEPKVYSRFFFNDNSTWQSQKWETPKGEGLRDVSIHLNIGNWPNFEGK